MSKKLLSQNFYRLEINNHKKLEKPKEMYISINIRVFQHSETNIEIALRGNIFLYKTVTVAEKFGSDFVTLKMDAYLFR